MNDRSISFEYEKKIWDAENTFYLQSKPSRIAKFLYHYEIYKNYKYSWRCVRVWCF